MSETEPKAQKILVVEDSHVQAKIICRHLEAMTTFRTVSADSLQEAARVLDTMRDEIFAAVVDLNLPDAPYGEAVDLVQSHGLAVIVLTATFKDEVRDALLARNVADYVLKESIVVLDDVESKIERLFKNQFIKALVVDDSRTARGTVRNLLEIQNYQVLEAENGRRALEVLDAHPDIKLIVTDYEMPEMDGYELTSEVRRRYKKQQLAIVGISGAGESAMTAKFLKHGANDFLHKPFAAEEFSWRVNQTVELVEIVCELTECHEQQAAGN